MAKTYLFWEPLSDNILQERDESGALVAEYTAEPGLYGNVISQRRSGVESQFHFDAVGSTLAVTDDNEQVTDARAYTAFGETTESTGGTVFQFQYIGKNEYYRGNVNGQSTVRRRSFAPQVIRWLSIDVTGSIGLTSEYLYVSNSPIISLDPSGEEADFHKLPRSPSVNYSAVDAFAASIDTAVATVGARTDSILVAPLPCGKIELNQSPPHPLVTVTFGACPFPPTRFVHLALRKKVDEVLNEQGTKDLPCPEKCPKCAVGFRREGIPILLPFSYLTRFCWTGAGPGLREAPCLRAGSNGPCFVIFAGALRLTLNLDLGICTK